MAEALFTVIGGTLINLAKVTHVENSSVAPGKVIVHFSEGAAPVILDGTVETVLLKLGGGREGQEKKRA